MDNTIIPSQGHASSVSTSISQESHPGSSRNHSESVNHGFLFWNQTRRNWIEGKMSQAPSKKQEPVKSWDATYESSFKTNKSYQEPVPLSGHASSVRIGNSQESHPGSSSNHSEFVNQDSKDSHPGSSSNDSDFVNHGLLLWNKTRTSWIEGKVSQNPSKKQETFCSNHSEVVNHDIQDSHPGSSSNDSESVNHGLLLWNQTRRNWINGKCPK